MCRRDRFQGRRFRRGYRGLHCQYAQSVTAVSGVRRNEPLFVASSLAFMCCSALFHVRHVAHCPLCGQTVDTQQFSFEAQTYFQILQHLFRRLRRRQCSQRSSPGHFAHYGRTNPAGATSAYPTAELESSNVSAQRGTAALPSFDDTDGGVTTLPCGAPCSLPPSSVLAPLSSSRESTGHAISSTAPGSETMTYNRVCGENPASRRNQRVSAGRSSSLSEPGGAEALGVSSTGVNHPGTAQGRVTSDGDDSVLSPSGTGVDVQSSSEPDEGIPCPKVRPSKACRRLSPFCSYFRLIPFVSWSAMTKPRCFSSVARSHVALQCVSSVFFALFHVYKDASRPVCSLFQYFCPVRTRCGECIFSEGVLLRLC